MSEISEDESGGLSKETEPASAGGNLFPSHEDDDVEGSKQPKQKSAPKAASGGDDLEDSFSELGAFDKPDAPASANGNNADDLIPGLEAKLEPELSSKPQKSQGPSGDDEGKIETEVVVETEKAPQKSSPEASEAPLSSSGNTPDLEKFTVPILKEMLKERGLKVSGRKAERTDRLGS
jgi:hypothetical protein